MKFEREVSLNLGTMETKTESNMTMTQIVEGKDAQSEYNKLLRECGCCIQPNQIEFEYNSHGVTIAKRDLHIQNRTIFFYSKTRFNSGQFDIDINAKLKRNFGNLNVIDYELYKFYSSSCIILFRYLYTKTEGVLKYLGSEHKINFDGRTCILTIDDFTQDFKKSGDSIEKQIEKMIYMNNRKHKIINEQQAQISLMQSQLQEQSKLIASLQSRLLCKKEEEEKVEDMFADWLKDDEEIKSIEIEYEIL